MKHQKISVLFCILIFSACSSFRPSPTIRSESCLDSSKLQVLQVLDTGILAHVCPIEFPSYYDDAFEACVSKGDLVFMEVDKSVNFFVDEQKVQLEKESCFVPNGTFSYTNKNNDRKTVRWIKIADSQVPNPDYTEEKKN